MQKGTTVLQNQDPKQNKECCEAQLCVSDRYPSLIEVENKRTGHFHADNRFDFENTAQAYPKTIEQNPTTYNRARAPQKYLFSLILYNLLNHCVHLYSLCKLGTVVQNSRIRGTHLRTFRQEHFTRILFPVHQFCP